MIYQLIQEDMAKVEARLRSMSEDRPDYLSELLAYSLESGGKRVLALTGKVSRETIQAAVEALQASPFVTEAPFAVPVEEVGE